MSPEQLTDKLTTALDDALDEFHATLEPSQREAYRRITELAKDLELKNGRIRPSIRNVRLIVKIRKELEDAILNDKYFESIDKLVKVIDEVDVIQSQYFSAVVASYTPSAVFSELKKQAIQSTVEGLSTAGISQNIGAKLQDILRVNITSGASFKELSAQLEGFMMDTKTGEGALKKYATTYSTTAVYQYSAQYNQLATNDLGFTWYVYSGGKQKTSRPFCVKMLEAANEGCMKYIHVSQIPELLKGHICSGDVGLNKKTGLPEGFIEGTTPSNFQVYRGGWNCRHKLLSVPSALVPKELRAKYD
jgi:hypothetical protein